MTAEVLTGSVGLRLGENLLVTVPSPATVKIDELAERLFKVENSGDAGTITIEDQAQVIELAPGDSSLRGRCDDIIAIIQDALDPIMFVNEKDRTKLIEKLNNATAKLVKGKCGDARDKLKDVQNKVVKLAAESKIDIDQEDVYSLVHKLFESITCVEKFVEGQ